MLGKEYEVVRDNLVNMMHIPWTKFGEAALENITLIDGYLQGVSVGRDLGPDWGAYKKDRIAVLRAHAKIEHGQPVVHESNYVIDPQKEADCKIKLQEIDDKYPALLKTIADQRAERATAMESAVDLKLVKVKYSERPNTLSGADLDMLQQATFMVEMDTKLTGEE
jgi:hypothetical protein